MWRTTGDVQWREHGYRVFQAIEKHTRTKFGYTTVSLSGRGVVQNDYMPRYLFYLFITTSGLKLTDKNLFLFTVGF